MSLTIQIRRLRKSELPQAEILKTAAVADSFAPNVPKLRRILTWERPTAPGRRLTYGNTIGAWLDEALVGVSRYVVAVNAISDVWVSAAHRQAGIGTGLLSAAESGLRRRGVKVAHLHTPSFNASAIAFYLGRGWRIKQLKRHKSLHYTVIEFTKRLN